ncbi:hypothetical protein [Paenibacillus sp. L3-i20]|uniref:hypothetical protein n=1 Tax=Paenibacillus sp. L3-i20 TaxID=2905833 RepID=UPI001EDE5CF2|nr:hypothetical protein [Paenibacillus sp. L3-i20]GKU77769.1 hypothetical protein L3i20_v221660 [Paenibacillus sp. L3-i20]
MFKKLKWLSLIILVMVMSVMSALPSVVSAHVEENSNVTAKQIHTEDGSDVITSIPLCANGFVEPPINVTSITTNSAVVDVKFPISGNVSNKLSIQYYNFEK